jgi:hypothetical protein
MCGSFSYKNLLINMATQKKNINTVRLCSTVSDEVGDYSNDPFVLKKVATAKIRLERIQLPHELLKRK